jgi:C-terminal processing protease CtpA/Prc
VIVRALAAAEGARAGDVIVTIDGEAAAARLARYRHYVACSNEASCGLFTLQRALAGKEGSTLALTVRGADGKTRALSVLRKREFWGEDRGWRTGDVVRILDGNIGYVDLDRLQAKDVDAMFDKLSKTRAIVFDLRGYPNQTAWPIAPRLNVNKAVYGASFQRPVAGGEPGYRHAFIQPLPTTDKPLYRGKTVMLVDERTISQAEHTGLFFEAAAGTRFIGSQTAGANGDVTVMWLPGGLSVSFTGHDVRHADGRQLQRVGLPIAVRVTPTIAGVQAGRDEVLERAMAVLRDGK